MRPLPQLTPANEWFWISGADGRLRIQQCQDCKALVIANVALAEDPTVHLTTNVVGCDPDEVHIGQEVMVRFEPADEVWLPLFEPTGETDTADLVDEPRRPAPVRRRAATGSSTGRCCPGSAGRRSDAG